MDLERLGAQEASQRLIRWYCEFSDEHHPSSLADHYIAARALVRSKVACIRADQGDVDARAQARDLLAMARDHLRSATVTLVLVGGAPGTGKSTLAQGLAEWSGWSLLRSDEVRKDLAGVGHATRTGAGFREGIYAADATRATYEALLERSRALLQLGMPVILDASWADARWRAEAQRVADATVSDLVELRCDAPLTIALERVRQRGAENGDASDATPAVAERMAGAFDDWPSATCIRTNAARRVVLDAAVEAVAARWR
jgi:predicted kinase